MGVTSSRQTGTSTACMTARTHCTQASPMTGDRGRGRSVPTARRGRRAPARPSGGVRPARGALSALRPKPACARRRAASHHPATGNHPSIANPRPPTSREVARAATKTPRPRATGSTGRTRHSLASHESDPRHARHFEMKCRPDKY